MKWKKKGLVFAPSIVEPWMVSHAQLPIADRVDKDLLRIYFNTRDACQRTVTTYLETRPGNPHLISYVHTKPVLGLGKLGCFDDSGAMGSWLVNHAGAKYLYYTGWNVGTTVGYRNAIGVAISEDGGKSFSRLYDGPIMDRTPREPFFCGVPCVMIDGDIWRMWYLSCVGWKAVKGKTEPYYHIKYAESHDGIEWERSGIVCIDFRSKKEAGIVRPCVIKEDGIYKMWYCYRGSKEYRNRRKDSYRIGYAESNDGVQWRRSDEVVGIDVSDDGWDSMMIAYPFVYEYNGTKYMLYNGNGFGQSGFGYAVLGEETGS